MDCVLIVPSYLISYYSLVDEQTTESEDSEEDSDLELELEDNEEDSDIEPESEDSEEDSDIEPESEDCEEDSYIEPTTGDWQPAFELVGEELFL